MADNNGTKEVEKTTEPSNFIADFIKEDIAPGGQFEGMTVHTRFPPEPNGCIHIGHVKALCISFGLAEKFGGVCNLRMDDTNPTKEREEFVEAIKDDIHWMGFDWGDRYHFASEYFEETYQYAVELMGMFALNKCETASIDGAILSSVAPAVTNAMCSAVSKVVGIEPLMVGPGIRTGLNIAINDPAELGADLLCASVAALHKYPLPNAVCDLGTASTIFVLDKDGKMIGGIIYPGIRTSLMALVNNAALLPQISYQKPKQVIGKNTIDSMRSGLILGAASLLDGMLERVEEELGMPVTAIATGGFSSEIVCNCKREFIIDENLVLDGLRILYEKNTKKSK